MKTTRRIRLQVEAMESKALLSTGLSAPAGASAIVAPATTTHLLQLHGTLTGAYVASQKNSDVGQTYVVFGSGEVGLPKRALAVGNLHTLGLIRTGRAGGTLDLVTLRGTLSLKLQGPVQDGFSPLPTDFRYVITGGTGANRHVTGSGTATLTLVPNTPPTLNHAVRGRFTLVLTGDAVFQPLAG